MNHSTADIVRNVLVNLGHGTMPSAGGAWPISVGIELDDPDDLMVLWDMAGRIDGRSMIDGTVWDHDGVQLQLRCSDFKTGNDKLSTVVNALDKSVRMTPVSIDTSSYLVWSISRLTTPNHLGQEPVSQRHIWTANLLVSVRQTA